MHLFEKILLAADGSEHSLRAAKKAVTIASHFKPSVIHLIYVVDSDTSKADVLYYWNTIDVTESRREKLIPVEQLLKDANVEYEIKIVHGDPGPMICKIANDEKVDLVVIGSRGLNRFQEMVLGSVSHKVAKRANCSVMIVK
jgi:nucleotide-binding universal stress UspA family protein